MVDGYADIIKYGGYNHMILPSTSVCALCRVGNEFELTTSVILLADSFHSLFVQMQGRGTKDLIKASSENFK